jgi:hypothetical protein
MDCFDDIQIEEFSSFDFVEKNNDNLFEDEEVDEKTLNQLLNSNVDF